MFDRLRVGFGLGVGFVVVGVVDAADAEPLGTLDVRPLVVADVRVVHRLGERMELEEFSGR